MPTRLIREGILSSDKVDSLSAGGEVFYRRLLNVVDDFGRYDGRLVMLRSACFPIRDVHVDTIEEWLDESIKAGLVRLYVVDSKPFVEVLNFRQQQRAQSKWPAFDGQQLCSCYADAKRMVINGCANVHLVVFESVSESESEVVSESEETPPTPPRGRERGKTEKPPPPGFAEFWQTWPIGRRKVARAACLAKWERGGLEEKFEQIVNHVRSMKESQQWQEGYEPAPLTYLNQRRWEDGPVPGGGGDQFAGVQ